MEWGSSRRTSGFGGKSVFCLVSLLFSVAADEISHSHSTLGVVAPHLYYTCPEGATAKMLCAQRGAAKYSKDVLKHSWLFTPHSDQHCSPGKHPRNNSHSHNHTGMQVEFTQNNMWLTLQNVTSADQGRYCCVVLDVQVDHSSNKHFHTLQKSHTHVVLQITPRRNGSQNCTVWNPTPPGGSVPVALAITACILALLALPLILVLVYKQRQSAQSHKRAQELVRMDSEALGHENPVFLGGSPQTKTRTVSQIMARQSSETGHHLLSEPGTPLSPPAHGDVFFPVEDTIPESPDFLV